jgi:FkbM family methyltransferase
VTKSSADLSYTQKYYLEGMLHREPDDIGVMDAYFTKLLEISRSRFGIMHASLPGYDSPLFFRGMTTDLFNMQQIFQHREYGFDFQQQPHRILDLGAYGGYAAVYFANRFPNAQILCVEPSPTNFRLLCLNTAPYENVKRIHGAIWHKATRLQLTEQIGGDWGNVFHERNDESTMGVPAYTVTDVINSAGWPGADMSNATSKAGSWKFSLTLMPRTGYPMYPAFRSRHMTVSSRDALMPSRKPCLPAYTRINGVASSTSSRA